MSRKLVIGDLHGGLKALKQALERARVQPSDELIFLGDIVDGWSESAQLVEFLVSLEQQNGCTFIYGNHDAWCHEWLRSGVSNSTWLEHGGKSTIESYQKIPISRWEAHKSFFDRMKLYHVDSENRLFIHAGFTSMHGPEKEHYSTNFNWDRTLWEAALVTHGKSPQENYFPERLKLFSEIYIGHTPTTNWDVTIPWQRATVWNIDTGAAFKGKLSIMDIETKAFWQSDQLIKLYPNEKGRNR